MRPRDRPLRGRAPRPSLPNYLALTPGSTWGIADDASRPSTGSPPRASSARLTAAGRSWRALEEGSPGSCPDASRDRYAVRHDPATHYTPIRAACARWAVPLTALDRGRLPAFSLVVPHLRHDMRDCPVSTGEAWLAGEPGRILRGAP